MRYGKKDINGHEKFEFKFWLKLKKIQILN